MVDVLYIIALGYPNKPTNINKSHYQFFYRMLILLLQPPLLSSSGTQKPQDLIHPLSLEEQTVFRSLLGKYPHVEHLKSYETLLAWVQRTLQAAKAPDHLVRWSPTRNLGGEYASKTWGPKVWRVFHLIAANYAVTTIQPEKAYYKFYELIQVVLPCETCRKHYAFFFKQYPPKTSSQEALKNWSFFIHDAVNVLLQKPRLRYLKKASSSSFPSSFSLSSSQSLSSEEEELQARREFCNKNPHLFTKNPEFLSRSRRLRFIVIKNRRFAFVTYHESITKIDAEIHWLTETFLWDDCEIYDFNIAEEAQEPSDHLLLEEEIKLSSEIINKNLLDIIINYLPIELLLQWSGPRVVNFEIEILYESRASRASRASLTPHKNQEELESGAIFRKCVIESIHPPSYKDCVCGQRLLGDENVAYLVDSDDQTGYRMRDPNIRVG